MAADSTLISPRAYGSLSQSSADQELAGEIMRDQETMESLDANFRKLFYEIAIRILPSQLQYFFSANQTNTPGDVRTNEMYDSTGANALQKFAAIVESVVEPRDTYWHKLTPHLPELLKDKPTAQWYYKTNLVLFRRRYASLANYAAQNFMGNESLGAFGTAAMFLDKLAGVTGTRYKNIHLSEFSIAENHQGLVDKLYRKFRLSARQAAQKWGEENLPDGIRNKVRTSPEDKFYFIHCVRPRNDYDPQRADAKGKPFESTYVSIEGKTVLQKGGYRKFPYAVSRYKQSSNEVLGRSPAMDILPALKTLNEGKKQILKQGQRILDPVLLGHDDGLLDSFDLTSGAYNSGAVSADGRLLVHALPTGNVAVGKEILDDERADVKDAFLISLMQIAVDNPTATAAEVLERAKEKGMLMAPILGRQSAEKHGAQIDRELDLAMADGEIDPPTAAMISAGVDGLKYAVEFETPLTQAQKAGEIAALRRSVEMARDTFNITQDPAIMRPFKWKTIMPDVMRYEGMKPDWIATDDEIAAQEQAHAQQMQAQQVVQAAPAAAAMVKANAASVKAGAPPIGAPPPPVPPANIQPNPPPPPGVPQR